MLIKSINHFVSKLSGKIPLQTVLIAAFAIQIFAAVGLTGWLSFHNGQQAVDDLASQLRREVTARIHQHLETYMAMPHLVNQINVDAIRMGLLNLENLSSPPIKASTEIPPPSLSKKGSRTDLEYYFWTQIQQFKSVSYIALGTSTGEYVGTQILNEGPTPVVTLYSTVGNNIEIWETDSQANLTQFKKTLENYDPRIRPWYKAAAKIPAGKPIGVWTDIYAYSSGQSMTISANQPVYDNQGKLLAVATADLTLLEINHFLSNLAISPRGQTFIMERTGMLVATSTSEQPFRINQEKQKAERFKATDSHDTLTRATAHYLTEHFGDLNQINHSQQLDFVRDGERQFLQVVPFTDQWGLDWLIVAVVPEADFMGRINANTHITVLLFISALILAMLIGIWTARWIVKPIVRLSQATQQLSTGEWNCQLFIERADEIGQLARAFNQMVKQLQASFIQLRENENRLKQFLEAVPVGVMVLDSNGKPYYINQRGQQLLGKDVAPIVTIKQLSEVYQVYLAGTDHKYPVTQLPAVRALRGESSTADDIEIQKGDKIIPLETWGTPIFDDNGKIAYAINAFQDITERKRAEAERERFTFELQMLNQAYERFVPREFLSFLDKQSVIDVQLGDHVETEMTILFSDIRDFTMLSENMTPPENFNFINAYLSLMEPIINKYQGFIDKYIGDAIMALFPTSADEAVQAAIAMLKMLVQYNQDRNPVFSKNLGSIHNQGQQPQKYQPLKIGIGLNTGPLMLGTVGGKNRMDGTVIADAVNLASRVEGLTKTYGTALLITEQTYQKLADVSQYQIRVIDRVKVKGKTQLITVYEVFDADPPSLIALKLKTRTEFEEGFKHYHQKQFDKAQVCFEHVLQINENDQAARVYLSRCQPKLFRE
jgi:PAS domain S-box-containing protein